MDDSSDQTSNDHSFNRGVDVSHLATPHISSSVSLANRSPLNTPGQSNSEDCNNESYQVRPNNTHNHLESVSNATQQSRFEHPVTNRNSHDDDNSNRLSSYDSNQEQNPQQSPRSHAPSPLNQYEQQQQQNPRIPSPEEIPQQQHRHFHDQANVMVQPQQIQQQLMPPIERPLSNSYGPTAKLSYDIISVREPLAKILAERQILQAQQQQRQLLGDHEYIEVYEERGSSCFYEEIAGSVTSSVTYDQIGAISNHNYQVLINAYAVANRQNVSNLDENDRQNSSSQNSVSRRTEDNNQQENMYDVTNPPDLVDGINNKLNNHEHSTSSNNQLLDQKSPQNDAQMGSTQLSESIPVYSVINKATRRSNSIMRTMDIDRPPRPPPKNPLVSQKQSTSAIAHDYSEPSTSAHPSHSPGAWNHPHNTPTSSYSDRISGNDPSEKIDLQKTLLPKPPPRFSKLPAFNAIDRPLPNPENFDATNNNDGKMINKNSHDEDCESLNNGYELLRDNLTDDQIDVGYEKIRESNQFSGGSLTSQFRPFQLLDNGGYESVQPIYSSPSNALAEPNYEAIAPATASELAAAATAKLTAAATVIEQILKQDQ